MKNPDLPTSLKYFKAHILGKTFEQAHSFMLMQIGLLMGLGWKYSEVLALKELIEARNIVAKNHSKKNYPYLNRLVDFVYTRDLANHSFGAWIEIKPVELLAINDIACDIIRNRSLKIKQLKLAGLLYAIHIQKSLQTNEIKQNLDKLNARLDRSIEKETNRNISSLISLITTSSNNKIIRISNPENFYFAADIDNETFKEYAELLSINLNYERWNDGGIKTALWIQKPKLISDMLSEYQIVNSKKYLNILAGISYGELKFLGEKTDEKSFNTLKNNFEQRYVISNLKYFANRPLPNFPFYRVDEFSNNLELFAPKKLINFKLVLVAYFGQKSDKYISTHLGLLPKSFRSLERQLNKLKQKLIMGKLYNKYYPISTPLKPNESGKHFEQIKNVHRAVLQLNRNGIMINKEKSNLISDQINLNIRSLQYSDNKEQLQNWLNELEHINNQLNGINNKYRITGYFTPHASNTHRMNCSRINLQGLVKEIKLEIFSAPENYVLLSADVSGQDIAIAANMASRIYNDPVFENLKDKNGNLILDRDQIKTNKVNIRNTLGKLSKTDELISKPIDYITQQILSSNSMQLSGLSVREIRNKLKTIIYSTFYGGSIKSKINELEKELSTCIRELKVDVNILKKHKYSVPKRLDVKSTDQKIMRLKNLFDQLTNDVWLSPEQYYNNEIFKFDEELNSDKFEIKSGYLDFKNSNSLSRIENNIPASLKKKLNPTIEESYNFNIQSGLDLITDDRLIYRPLSDSNLNHYYSDILNLLSLEETKNTQIEQIKLLNKLFHYYLKEEYPGILDSMAYYEIYLKQKHSLTYPTLLGWQTVVDDLNQKNPRYVKTKSKAYPIQASGAEFIRQWILELSKIKGYQNSFKLVNVIHDQVMVESKKEHQAFISKEIIKAAKVAAQRVGLIPETIHIPEMEVLYP